MFIHPGEVYFGSGKGRVRTILGSCVAIVLWHPVRRVGGMCHFVLPGRSPHRSGLDGRYAEDAFELLTRGIQRYSTSVDQYRAWVYGGGNMFPGVSANQPLVGDRNVEAALDWLRSCRMAIHERDLGMNFHRKVTLDLDSGHVTVASSEIANFGLRESA